MGASAWHGARHYAEGTANTSGGIPAILHDNEAVIPLLRGRSIPVEMKGGDKSQGGERPIVNNLSLNLQAKDQDSFRGNSAQVQEKLMKSMGRLLARNG